MALPVRIDLKSFKINTLKPSKEVTKMKTRAFMSIVIILIILTGDYAIAIHETIPAETESTETPGTTIMPVRSPRDASYRLKALINLLEKKGLITQDELQMEINILREKDEKG